MTLSVPALAEEPQAEGAADSPMTPTPRQREVRFEHSSNLAETFASLNASLVVSTYQAG
jgi:hypothetical protein